MLQPSKELTTSPTYKVVCFFYSNLQYLQRLQNQTTRRRAEVQYVVKSGSVATELKAIEQWCCTFQIMLCKVVPTFSGPVDEILHCMSVAWEHSDSNESYSEQYFPGGTVYCCLLRLYMLFDLCRMKHR